MLSTGCSLIDKEPLQLQSEAGVPVRAVPVLLLFTDSPVRCCVRNCITLIVVYVWNRESGGVGLQELHTIRQRAEIADFLMHESGGGSF